MSDGNSRDPYSGRGAQVSDAPQARVIAFRHAVKDTPPVIIHDLLKFAIGLSHETRRTLTDEAFFASGSTTTETIGLVYRETRQDATPTASLQLRRISPHLYKMEATACTGENQFFASSRDFNGRALDDIRRHILYWAAVATRYNHNIKNQSVIRELSFNLFNEDVYEARYEHPESPAPIPKYLDAEGKTLSLEFRRRQAAPTASTEHLEQMPMHMRLSKERIPLDAIEEMITHGRELCDSVGREAQHGGRFRMAEEKFFPLGGRCVTIEYTSDLIGLPLPERKLIFKENPNGSLELHTSGAETFATPKIFAPDYPTIFYDARAALHEWARRIVTQAGSRMQRGALENFIDICERLENDPLPQPGSPFDRGPSR